MPDMQPSPVQPLAPRSQQQVYELPLGMVGGNTYGRYPKISAAQTYNMMISDGFLVDYAGYKNSLQLSTNPNSVGRGIYSSTNANIIIAVIDNAVFSISSSLVATFVGSLATSQGEVYISENNGGQIAISDLVHIYIYNPNTLSFQTIITDFIPGFLAFQNTVFICASVGTAQWRLSGNNDGTTWPNDSAHVGQLQTKPDEVQAFVPMPGRGNMGFLFGRNVCEQWTFTGAALFPYQRQNSFNIDYGCINPASIAYQGNYIVWIGVSEEAGPVIMYTTGGDIKQVSTDGIDFLFSTLKFPEDCSGFIIKLDGHLFYQVTFKSDNISLLLDLESNTFFTVTDENLNYHIAHKIVFFNNQYYFVSFNDPNLYAFGTEFTNYQYSDTNILEIPRIRITPPIRLPSQRPMIFKSLGFTIEQGQSNVSPFAKVELATSRDGGESFGNNVELDMNPTGSRKSRFIFQRLGRANDFSARIRFIGLNRFVVGEGVVEAWL